MNYELFTQQ